MLIDPVQLAVFKAREAQQAADRASGRGSTAAAARLNQNAAGWRRAAIRAQARKEDSMTRQHPEIEVMRNKFYDEDPGREDACRVAIRIALNWVLNPTLSDTDITGYLSKPGRPAGSK